jgi:hypothetical protein
LFDISSSLQYEVGIRIKQHIREHSSGYSIVNDVMILNDSFPHATNTKFSKSRSSCGFMSHTAQGGRKIIIKRPPFWCVTPHQEYKEQYAPRGSMAGSDLQWTSSQTKRNDKQQTTNTFYFLLTLQYSNIALERINNTHYSTTLHIILYCYMFIILTFIVLFFDRSCPVVLLKLCYGQYNTACRT